MNINELRNQIFSCNDCGPCHHHQDIAGGYRDQTLAVITINPTGKECKTKPCRLSEKDFETLKKYSDEFMDAVVQYLKSRSCAELHGANINFNWWENFKETFISKGNVDGLRKIAVLDLVKHVSPTQRDIKCRFKKCRHWEKQLGFLPNLKGIILAGKKPQKEFARVFKIPKRFHHGEHQNKVKIGARVIDILMAYAISDQTRGRWNKENDKKKEIQEWIKEHL